MEQGAAPQQWEPSFNPWLVAVSVMLATVMEVLDTSVANVALPHIAGNLSATSEEATWVLTSYLISNAIILPATSWIGKYIGRKRFLIICIIIFTIASALCGAAPESCYVDHSPDPAGNGRRRCCSRSLNRCFWKVFRPRSVARPWQCMEWGSL